MTGFTVIILTVNCRSHDQRALPAIPHAGSGQGLTTDEEEDVDEGHYDVISNRRHKASTPQTASNTASPSRQNLYEKVRNILSHNFHAQFQLTNLFLMFHVN